MWKKATDQYLPDLNTMDHGWEMKLQWFKGAKILGNILQALDRERFTQDVQSGPRKVKPTTILLVTFECLGEIQ